MSSRSPAILASFVSLALLVMGACESPITVAIDVDPESDLAIFESYAWISDEPLIEQVDGVTHGPRVSPIDDQRIRRAVDTRLAAKGWKRVELEDADLVVSYGVGADQKTEFYESPGYGHYGHGYGYGYGYGGWYAESTVYSRTYTEGTLTLEFFDRRTRQATWVGWASKRLSESDERGELIERAIDKILTDFPPRS
jgi:hypothetical protein